MPQPAPVIVARATGELVIAAPETGEPATGELVIAALAIVARVTGEPEIAEPATGELVIVELLIVELANAVTQSAALGIVVPEIAVLATGAAATIATPASCYC